VTNKNKLQMMQRFRRLSLPEATRRYSELVSAISSQSAEAVGFGWRASSVAPSSLAEVQFEARLSRATGLPFRVSSLHCDQVVLSASVNQAFRFWHDMTHLQVGTSFDTVGEIEVGQRQLEQFEQLGVSPRSLVWRLLFADTIGQTRCVSMISRFPYNQRRFTLDYLYYGLDTAIRMEAARAKARELRATGHWRSHKSASTTGGVSLQVCGTPPLDAA
jgi:hypothetical protein